MSNKVDTGDCRYGDRRSFAFLPTDAFLAEFFHHKTPSAARMKKQSEELETLIHDLLKEWLREESHDCRGISEKIDQSVGFKADIQTFAHAQSQNLLISSVDPILDFHVRSRLKALKSRDSSFAGVPVKALFAVLVRRLTNEYAIAKSSNSVLTNNSDRASRSESDEWKLKDAAQDRNCSAASLTGSTVEKLYNSAGREKTADSILRDSETSDVRDRKDYEQRVEFSYKPNCVVVKRSQGALSKTELKKQAIAYMKEIAADPDTGSPVGNWNARVWKLGLEWGGGFRDSKGTPLLTLDHDLSLDARIPGSGAQEAFRILDTRYNEFLGVFFNVLFEWGYPIPEKSPWQLDKMLETLIRTRRFLCPDGPVCSLNLYPFNRPDHASWKKLGLRINGRDVGNAAELLRLPTAQSYHEFLMPIRKEAFKDKIVSAMNQHPLLICSFGLGDKKQFGKAVGADEQALSDPINEGSDYPVFASPLYREEACANPGWLVALPFISSRWAGTMNTPSKTAEYAREVLGILPKLGLDISQLKIDGSATDIK